MVNQRLLAASGALLFSLSISACAQRSPVNGEVARKLYTDAQSLAADANVIVRGTLGAVVAKTVDSGGSSGGLGIPTVIYSFAVKRSVPVNAVPAVLSLAWVDTDKLKTDAADPLTQGAEYVLFLERLGKGDRGGLQEFDTLYVPVSSNAGVFSITGGKARATDREFERLLTNGPVRERDNDRMTVGADELLALKPR